MAIKRDITLFLKLNGATTVKNTLSNIETTLLNIESVVERFNAEGNFNLPLFTNFGLGLDEVAKNTKNQTQKIVQSINDGIPNIRRAAAEAVKASKISGNAATSIIPSRIDPDNQYLFEPSLKYPIENAMGHMNVDASVQNAYNADRIREKQLDIAANSAYNKAVNGKYVHDYNYKLGEEQLKVTKKIEADTIKAQQQGLASLEKVQAGVMKGIDQELRAGFKADALKEKEQIRMAKSLDKVNTDLFKGMADTAIGSTRGMLADLDSQYQKYIMDMFKLGFGMHVVQMYITPIVQGLQQLTSAMVSAYAEFDQKYADYVAKSDAYGETLSQTDFYNTAVGNTYAINEAATAAERFAASGIDVAQNQEALTAILQTATSAHMDYADSANGVIKTMQSMHMEISQITEITDAMTNAANASSAELSDLIGWFEYASSSAYQAGVDVKQLSAYLGILASTGTPNTGAAMRQLFLQMSKEDVQGKFMEKYDWISEEDFYQMDVLIGKMRDYVQSSDDQAKASLEMTRLIGGKANAQQALNNLLVAEPDLWNQVTSAVQKTGTTQDLYNKVTSNTADYINRIKVNLNILLAQFGEFMGPILKVVSDVLTVVTKLVIALPSPVKALIGVFILLATGLATVLLGAISLAGGLFILKATMKQLAYESITEVFSLKGLGAGFKSLTLDVLGATSATTIFGVAFRNLMSGIVLAGTGAMIGYSLASESLQKNMFDEARVVSLLTSAWIALSVARAGGFVNPYAWAGGILAGGAYASMMEYKIEEMEWQAKHGNNYGKPYKQTTINKNYNFSVANLNSTSSMEDWEEVIGNLGSTVDTTSEFEDE